MDKRLVTVLVVVPLVLAALVFTFASRRETAAWQPATKLTEKQAARLAVVEDAMRSIQAGVEKYAADHAGHYPSASDVSQTGAVGRRYRGSWPTDPYTGGPMEQGSDPGDFVYTVAPDGRSYCLVAHLWAGEGDYTVP